MEQVVHSTIKLEPPSWKLLGDLAIDQLKQGHTDYAIGVIPMMVEKLTLLEQYANEDGTLSVNFPAIYNKSIGEANKEFKENYPKRD